MIVCRLRRKYNVGKYKGEKFDIFISYRRDGGEDEAWKLKLFLERSGYRAFMDREALRSGNFNEQLYQCIDGCKEQGAAV